MKRTLIAMLAVLAVSLSLCAASMALLNGAVEEAQALRSQAVLAAEERRTGEAKTLLLRLAEEWDERGPLLEMLASHDALHEVQSAIAEGQVCLECEDHDDFLRIMSNLDGALRHLSDAEALRWSNLY